MFEKRKYPIGAEIVSEGVDFRVYAPLCKKVEVSLENPPNTAEFFPLTPESNGYFSGSLPQFSANSLYRFRLDESQELYPDPASRFQPEGPFGPSQVIKGQEYTWSDQEWKGVPIDGQVIYEMHIGTFTPEGTFAAAQKELQELANLGVTILEIMPLNDFPGRFGWGYDGVNLFAPTRLYGTPNDVKNFINEAHRLKLAVILDVVYNHFGPDGNFISKFSEDYFLETDTDWGRAINFDNENSRLFFLTNVRYWIEEFHFDGLRLDATHSIFSTTSTHILADINKIAKESGSGRRIIVVGENESQQAIIIKPVEKGGYGFDALWNDDFHHTSIVRLTGRREAYYTDYKGSPQEFISSLKHGFLFQGQYYVWQKKNRGTPALDLPPSAFIQFLQNHDQIANSGNGQRVHLLTDFGNLKAMTCLLLIAPNTPMLFQGQEFAASSPFYYFADHSPELKKLIHKGRKEELSQFQNLATDEMQAQLTDPGNLDTFMKSKINFEERQKNQQTYQLHKDLIKLRRSDPVFNKSSVPFVGSVLNENAFLLRFFGSSTDQRLVLINFGPDYELNPAPEPLLAPPEASSWKILWSSESSQYGGQGTPPILESSILKLTGHSALIFSTMEMNTQ